MTQQLPRLLVCISPGHPPQDRGREIKECKEPDGRRMKGSEEVANLREPQRSCKQFNAAHFLAGASCVAQPQPTTGATCPLYNKYIQDSDEQSN